MTLEKKSAGPLGPGESGPSNILPHELDLLKKIQNMMLPKKNPVIEGFELDAFYLPCATLSGDYYDFIEVDQNHIGLVVADVAGKGLPAAVVMVQTRTLMRAESKETQSPKEALIRMNRGLYGEIPPGLFVTMYYALLDIQNSELIVSSAGHNPLLFWREKAKNVARVKTEGMPLGIDKGLRFEKAIQEMKFRLQPGDCFLIHTDGVNEATNLREEEYGDQRLGARFAASAKLNCSGLIKSILADLNQFRGGAPQFDDITMIAVRHTQHRAATAEAQPRRIVDGEKFVVCKICGTVNPRTAVTCVDCDESMVVIGELRLDMGENELECACGQVFRIGPGVRNCSRCGRILCVICHQRFPVKGTLCEFCSG